MYLTINDYMWNETAKEVVVQVPMRGLSASKADVLITSHYLKLVIKPYIFECVPYSPIDVDQSRLEICDGLATFVLTKSEPKLWGALMSEDMKDKKNLQKIRENAIEEFQQHEKNRCEARKTGERAGEKKSLSELMKIETEVRERVAKEKKEAAEQAMKELVEVHKAKCAKNTEMQKQIAEAQKLAHQMSEKRALEQTVEEEIKERVSESAQSVAIFNERPVELPVRESNTIAITFTPRVFPTPERESVKQQEEEWLSKQAEHRRAAVRRITGGSGDLSEKELDPIWLRNKGDSLFRAGDYEAAVVAYTEAISINPKLHSAYSNRAACHLKLRNFFKALEDSSTALDLCTPAVAQNLRSRVRAHVRRAVAFCNLNMYKEGLVEYKAAHKLDPDDGSIKADLEAVDSFIAKQSNLET
ncbi:unnamed protein product [Calicophoron daubneyi]|uniref:CS domain-containing protein n=1 Tax=Calicophoron daubneyi TaxID=300641 RepID=A0AAV2TUC6_CALDB